MQGLDKMNHLTSIWSVPIPSSRPHEHPLPRSIRKFFINIEKQLLFAFISFSKMINQNLIVYLAELSKIFFL